MTTKKAAKAAAKKAVPAAGETRGRKPKFSLPADHPLEVAARLAGGKQVLADALGITRNSMRGMERRLHAGRPFPPERVIPICAVSGQRPADYRPDVFHADWKIPGVRTPTAAQLARAVEANVATDEAEPEKPAKAPRKPRAAKAKAKAVRKPRARKAAAASEAAAAA